MIRAGAYPPLGRRRSKLSTGQFLCAASVQVLSISRPKKEIPEWVSLFLVRVKGLDSRGGVPPLGRRRSKLSTGQFLCTASVQVLSISRPKKEIPEWVSLFLVRVKGLEPSRSCPHKNLNLTRLPIPPHPHMITTHCCEIIFISRQSSFFFSRQSVA